MFCSNHACGAYIKEEFWHPTFRIRAGPFGHGIRKLSARKRILASNSVQGLYKATAAVRD
jgi:hypothetical protein